MYNNLRSRSGIRRSTARNSADPSARGSVALGSVRSATPRQIRDSSSDPCQFVTIFHEDTVVATTVRVQGGLFRLRTSTDSHAKAATTSAIAPARPASAEDINVWH